MFSKFSEAAEKVASLETLNQDLMEEVAELREGNADLSERLAALQVEHAVALEANEVVAKTLDEKETELSELRAQVDAQAEVLGSFDDEVAHAAAEVAAAAGHSPVADVDEDEVGAQAPASEIDRRNKFYSELYNSRRA